MHAKSHNYHLMRDDDHLITINRLSQTFPRLKFDIAIILPVA